MNDIKDFKDLIVWQKAMDLVVEVYNLVKKLPKEEQFALSDQMRHSIKEYTHFLSVAKGSNAELETQLLLCVKINYLNNSDIERAFGLIKEVGKMLTSLQKSLTISNTQ